MRPFVGTPTDYSDKHHWLAKPDDPGKAVDLIYLYPSSCIDINAGVICAVDNRSMLRGAKRNFSQQATTFEPIANMFAPYWKQVNAMKLPANADATIDLERGTVIVSEPRLAKCVITAIPGLKRFESVFGPASYHGCDYSFFFMNIRENARVRSEAWFASRGVR